MRNNIYPCFDFGLRSAIPLPEFGLAQSDSTFASLVEVTIAPVPEHLPGGQHVGHGLQVAEGEVLLTVPEVARYHVRGGREIVVDPAPEASDTNIRLFLLGSALGILCHQRGALLLHANAVVADNGAFAFAGHSGAGKSTLAAYFQRAGYEVLCDDVCMVHFDETGQPFAWPGLPRLKLWGEAAVAFGHDRADLDVAVAGMDKYHVPLVARSLARPVPFRRLYVLDRAPEGEEGTVERLRGGEAMAAVLAQTYRPQYLAPMGLKARHFAQCATLIQRAEIYAATRAWGYDRFDHEAGRLARHLSTA
jgi:hypothetical protein